MAATNIFYRIPSKRGTRVATIPGTECTLHQFCDYIINSEGINQHDFIIASGTKVFRPNSCNLSSISLHNNSHVEILIPLLGGKGGFGSLLRAIGAQIEKTTNRDACRDLSGRRLRDIKSEDELRKLIALQEKLQIERKRRKEEKLELLKKRSSKDASERASIQELISMFDDNEYNKRRMELGDIIEAAVEKGIINFKKRQIKESEESENAKKQRLSGSKTDEYEESDSSENDISNATNASDAVVMKSHTNKNSKAGLDARDELQPIKPSSRVKKDDLWLGLEE